MLKLVHKYIRRLVVWVQTPFSRDEVVVEHPVDAEPAIVCAAASVIVQRSPEELAERRARRKITKARIKIADTASDILDRFERLSHSTLEGGSHSLDSQRSLELLLGCDFHLIAGISDNDLGVAERSVFAPQDHVVDLAAMTWPIDQGVICRKENHYYLNRVFTAKPEQIRGQTKIFTTKAIFCVYAALNDDGSWWAETRIGGLINGKWMPIDDVKTVVKGGKVRSQSSTKTVQEEFALSASMMFSFALTERYEWHAAFGAEDGPRLLLPTSSGGASALFKNRELMEGAKRRAALRHWVHNHYRSKETDIAYVRDHLRGATRFSWCDLPCELLVSAFDLEKNGFFKTQAAQWRAARAHNRVKVRLKRAV
jgi:hypothetical protein